ncbi:MAG TPA: hypothetical protein VEY89_04100 [Candidatus Dormibacteraeota bacterium]|nr:hypothetical protein [Candidatus Dormibacteraeota bacterium]
MLEKADVPTTGDARDAARRAVEPTGLLKGEDPESRHPDDVKHWINAYSELVHFKEGVLGKSRGAISGMDNPSSRKEATEVDVTILSAELARYRERLDFWLQRREELQTERA